LNVIIESLGAGKLAPKVQAQLDALLETARRSFDPKELEAEQSANFAQVLCGFIKARQPLPVPAFCVLFRDEIFNDGREKERLIAHVAVQIGQSATLDIHGWGAMERGRQAALSRRSDGGHFVFHRQTVLEDPALGALCRQYGLDWSSDKQADYARLVSEAGSVARTTRRRSRHEVS